MSSTVGIGVIGLGAAGIRHARACLQVPIWYADSGIAVRRVVCADVNEGAARSAAEQFGFDRWTGDWREVVADPDVDAVVIATPNRQHRAIVSAAAAQGKHVLCEKPVGASPADTEAVAAAVASAGIAFMVGYNYRCVPAVAHARSLIENGQIGHPTHYRGRYFIADGSDPETPLSWRFVREHSGWGTLADLTSHVIDTAMFLFGPIRAAVSDRKIFISERPLPGPAGAAGLKGEVENEDYVAALIRFENGAQGTLECCRAVLGPTNEMAFELNASAGSLKWSLERMHEVAMFIDSGDARGYASVLSRPQFGSHARFNRGAGNGPSLMDLKTIEFHTFLGAVLGRTEPSPGIDDALAVARVQAAIARSWESNSWEPVGSLECPPPTAGPRLDR